MTNSEMRVALVSRLNFQIDTCRTDLLNDGITCLALIQHLTYILDGGFHLELTMVKTGHHDDGPHGHYGGYAADGWPLNSSTSGDWVDPGSHLFRAFLQRCASSPWNYQVGLAGSAYTPANMTAAGATAFEDSGADHVHIGAKDI